MPLEVRILGMRRARNDEKLNTIQCCSLMCGFVYWNVTEGNWKWSILIPLACVVFVV